MKSEIAVLYVARGGEGGYQALAAFMDRYRSYPGGTEHELILLAKNWPDHEKRSINEIAEATGASIRWLPDDGFDWGAYIRALPGIESRYICLLNSHSRPRVSGWLAKLSEAILVPGVGLAGATGSWESAASATMMARGGISGRLRGLASRLRHAHHLAGFPPFPNPHIRSTGLIMERSMLIEFALKHPVPEDKSGAHWLESGRNGLSAFVRSKQRELVVVDTDGTLHLPTAWPASRTFRSGDQTKLLIEDNRTRDFECSARAQRRYLAQLAWGNPELGELEQASAATVVATAGSTARLGHE